MDQFAVPLGTCQIWLRNSSVSSVFRQFDRLLGRIRKWSTDHSIPHGIFNKSHAESFALKFVWQIENAQVCSKVFVRSTKVLSAMLQDQVVVYSYLDKTHFVQIKVQLPEILFQQLALSNLAHD